ncbi:MAG: hypothetical protein KC448_14965, partial [Yoonia sp.]|nr:hypothetical protein [Yoonia sp.]
RWRFTQDKSSRRSEAVRKFGRIIQTPESHSLSPSIQKSGNQGLRVYLFYLVKYFLDCPNGHLPRDIFPPKYVHDKQGHPEIGLQRATPKRCLRAKTFANQGIFHFELMMIWCIRGIMENQ